MKPGSSIEVTAQSGGFQGKSLKALERGIRGMGVPNYTCSAGHSIVVRDQAGNTVFQHPKRAIMSGIPNLPTVQTVPRNITSKYSI
jgi:hypothetical protein